MQLPSTSVKKCSQCQTPADLDALLCDNCGRVFPMQSAEAVVRAPASIAVAQPRQTPARRAAFGSVFLVAVIAAAFGVHTWYEGSHNHEDGPAPVATGPQSGSKTTSSGHALPTMAPNPQFYHASDHPR